MLEKYKATLIDGHFEWDGEAPKAAKKKGPVKLEVVVVSDTTALKKPNSKKMVEALEKIAALGGVKSIPDPDKWLREIRKDRPLPGRR